MVGLQWVGFKMPPWHPFARSKFGGWGSVRRTDIGKKIRVGDHHMTSTAGRMEFLSWKKILKVSQSFMKIGGRGGSYGPTEGFQSFWT